MIFNSMARIYIEKGRQAEKRVMLTDLLRYLHRIDYLGPHPIVSAAVGAGSRYDERQQSGNLDLRLWLEWIT